MSIVTGLWTGQSRFRIPTRERNLCFFQNVQSGSGAYPASFSVGYQELFPRGSNVQDVRLATCVCLVLRLRMSGCLTPLLHGLHGVALIYSLTPRGRATSQLPVSQSEGLCSIPSQSAWDFWWLKCHCAWFFSESFGLLLPASFYQCCTLMHSAVTEATGDYLSN